MRKKNKRLPCRKIVLKLPDLDHAKSAVLNSLSSPHSRRNYKFPMEHRSRPRSLVVPLTSLPPEAMTFTLGDSMNVAASPRRRVYTLQEVRFLFAEGEPVSAFGLTDRHGPPEAIYRSADMGRTISS
jgi:hypothetical protein